MKILFMWKLKRKKQNLINQIAPNPEIVMIGDKNAIVRICEGKRDFTHAISRDQITAEKGKVMDIIRLSRVIMIVLKTKY